MHLYGLLYFRYNFQQHNITLCVTPRVNWAVHVQLLFLVTSDLRLQFDSLYWLAEYDCLSVLVVVRC